MEIQYRIQKIEPYVRVTSKQPRSLCVTCYSQFRLFDQLETKKEIV